MDLCRQTEGEINAVMAEAVPLRCWGLAAHVSSCAVVQACSRLCSILRRPRTRCRGRWPLWR